MNHAELLPRIDDRLPECFLVDHSESEWLLTLLSVAELAYIFDDPAVGHGRD